MAEDIRLSDSEAVVQDKRIEELVAECDRQVENCEYTSAGLYIWQKRARFWRNTFVVVPIILGGAASSQIFGDFDANWVKILSAILALLAGFFPAIYEALGMNMQIQEIGRFASEYTNLKDRFRQASRISRHSPYGEFHAGFEALMDRMDAARSESPPVPEWCFIKARKKITSGHYVHRPDGI